MLAGHARMVLWEGYQGYQSHPERYGLVDKLLVYAFAPLKWGHAAVLLFFVLSGFLIHLGYAIKLKHNPLAELKLGQYFVKRIRRIYPPFLLALIVTFALDAIGKSLYFSVYRDGTPYELINIAGRGVYDLKTMLGNLFFLFEEHVPIFGVNKPTWSLKFEWWFYCIYPMFLFMARRSILYATGLLFALFVMSFFPNLWVEPLLKDVFSAMVCWWVGVLLAEVYSKRLKLSYPVFSGICLAGMSVLFFVKTSNYADDNFFKDFQIAFAFGALISGLLWLQDRGISLRLLERLKPIGDFSYTLYITHFPILMFASGFLLSRNGNVLPSHSWFIFAGIIVCMTLAYGLHFIVEVPFLRSNKPGPTKEKNLVEAS